MRVTATFFALAPLLALAQPAKLVARQDAPVEVPEGPLPVCTNYCFGMWGWPITLCTGQEGLNHLIRCFNEHCVDEPSRVHAQLAAEQNCEEGMGWPDRMPEDLEVLAAAPGDEDDEDTESSASASATASPSGTATSSGGSSPSATGSASASASESGVPTGAFDVEGSEPSASETQTPNGARQTAYAGYAGVAAAAMAGFAIL